MSADLTAEQVAEALNLPLAWIKRGIRNKTIPHIAYGPRNIRFTPEQVEQIRQSHAVTPKQSPANPYGRKTRATS